MGAGAGLRLLGVGAVLLAGRASANTLEVPTQFATIQAAVDAAGPGDTIIVLAGLPTSSDPEGIYHEAVVVGKSGLELVGHNAVIAGGLGAPCIRVTADDVTVRGFTLQDGTNGVLVQDDVDGTVLGFSASKNVIVAMSGAGIEVHGGGASLAGNRVTGCSGIGLNITSGAADPVSTVAANVVRGSLMGIGVDGPSFVIHDNTCTANSGTGLGAFLTPTEVGMPTAVSHNTCEDNAGDGFDVFSEGGTLTAERNVARFNGSVGMQIEGDALLVRHNTCEGNSGPGMQFVLGDYGNATPDVLDGNRVSHNGQDGMAVYAESDNATIISNRAFSNRLTGIYVYGPGLSVTGNTCTGNRVAGLAAQGSGQHLDHNTVTGNPGMGIYVDGDATTVDANVVTSNGRDGIELKGTNHVVSNNDASDNGGDGIDIEPGPDQFNVVASGHSLLNNQANRNANEGIDNGGVDTIMQGNNAFGDTGPDIAGGGDGGLGSVFGTIEAFNASNHFGDASGKGVSAQLDLDAPFVH